MLNWQELDEETLSHITGENRRQTLEEEIAFIKLVHEQVGRDMGEGVKLIVINVWREEETKDWRKTEEKKKRKIEWREKGNQTRRKTREKRGGGKGKENIEERKEESTGEEEDAEKRKTKKEET